MTNPVYYAPPRHGHGYSIGTERPTSLTFLFSLEDKNQLRRGAFNLPPLETGRKGTSSDLRFPSTPGGAKRGEGKRLNWDKAKAGRVKPVGQQSKMGHPMRKQTQLFSSWGPKDLPTVILYTTCQFSEERERVWRRWLGGEVFQL